VLDDELAEDSDKEDDRKEEAIEREMLLRARRAARMPRSHSTGHSLFAAAAAGNRRRRATTRGSRCDCRSKCGIRCSGLAACATPLASSTSRTCAPRRGAPEVDGV
jgi:hypothetical protein